MNIASAKLSRWSRTLVSEPFPAGAAAGRPGAWRFGAGWLGAVALALLCVSPSLVGTAAAQDATGAQSQPGAQLQPGAPGRPSAPPVLDDPALRRRQEAQLRARELTRALITGVLDVNSNGSKTA